MKNIRSAFRLPASIAVLAVLLALTGTAAAQPDDSAKQIPDPLKQWEAWATWKDEHRLCPTPYSDANKHLCLWPSRFGLQAEQSGGKFDLVVTVNHEIWVPLTGNNDLWPLDVRANGAPVVV